MSRVRYNRNRLRLKKLVGIRARLALLALILVAPLILERARSLEDARAKQIAQVAAELSSLAQRSAHAQQEVVSSVETVLKSAAYIRAWPGGIARSCDILRASLPVNLPWIRTLLIVGGDGRVQCSTNHIFVGVDLSDRAYLKKARESGQIVFSDHLFAKLTNNPVVMAAYPVSAINGSVDSVILAGVNLDWMSKIMGDLGGRPGISAALVDSTGIVLAAPPDQASMIGRPLDSVSLLSAIAEPEGSVSFAGPDGSKRALSFARVNGTQSRLIISIDEPRYRPASTARSVPPTCSSASSACSCCWAR